MTITSFVVINSKHRTPDSRTSTDFNYSIGQALEVKAVAVKSVSIPNLQYNINSTNKELFLKFSTFTTSLRMPDGQYDMATFRTTLEAMLGIVIGDLSLTITQHPQTQKLTFKADNVPFQFIRDATSPLAKICGFPISDDVLPLTLEIPCPHLPNLGGLKNYYLTSQTLSQGFNGLFKNGLQKPLLMTIPIAVPWGQVEHYEPDSLQLNLKTYNRPQNIQMIDIQVLDEDLRVVDLNGADIEIVMKIYSESSLEHGK
jgi:hypothetical protein